MIPPDSSTSREPAAPAQLHVARSPAPAPYAHDFARVDLRHVLRALGDPLPAAVGVGDGSFRVVQTACTFGGRLPGRRRAWVLCRCGRRVGVLYAPHDSAHFACRTCWSLRYASDTWHGAARRRRQAFRIRARLGDVGPFEDYVVVGFRAIPPRPRGMPRSTYDRLVEELAALEEGAGPGLGGRPVRMRRRTFEATVRTIERAADDDERRAELGVMLLRAARVPTFPTGGRNHGR